MKPVLWRAADPDGGVHHFTRRPENVCTEVAWATADGRATIHHGDCLDVMRSMADGSVDVVWTSPPYNQLGSRIPAKGSGCISNRGFIDNVNRCGYADDMPEDEYVAFLARVAEGVANVLRPGGSFFFNHKIRYRDSVPLHPWDMVRAWPGFSVRQEIVWDRRKSIVFNARMYAPSDERIYWLVRDGAKHAWNQEAAGLLSVWNIPANETGIEHPCPTPVEVVAYSLASVASRDCVVLDPFGGSGTTAVAALREGCRAILIEDKAAYVEIAKARVVHAAAQGNLFHGSVS